jgi:hypothetical protein
MSQVVEINEEGTLRLPPEVIEQVKPHKRFAIEVDNGTLILRPETEEQPFWATATPEEWVEHFHQWLASIRVRESGPPLPDEALRRENIYD